MYYHGCYIDIFLLPNYCFPYRSKHLSCKAVESVKNYLGRVNKESQVFAQALNSADIYRALIISAESKHNLKRPNDTRYRAKRICAKMLVGFRHCRNPSVHFNLSNTDKADRGIYNVGGNLYKKG